jgi:hypothetical protein
LGKQLRAWDDKVLIELRIVADIDGFGAMCSQLRQARCRIGADNHCRG